MTEAINIGNLPAITSLPTGTYMVAIDSNGQLAKITKANATNATYSSSCSSPQWIRIGSFSQTAGCLLSIGSQWRNTQGVRILLNCLLHVNAPSYNHIEVLSVLANTGTNVVFKKCRVVIKSGSAGYLDVYYEAPNQNSVFFSASANYYFNLYDSPQLDAQIPDGYSVKEFDIPTVGGGGKTLCINALHFDRASGERRAA